MKVLGISAFYHDSAVALVEDDSILVAVQEERFTRKKHDESFPVKSLQYVFDKYKLSSKDIEAIVFYEKPLLKFDRIIESYIGFAPNGFRNFKNSLPLWSRTRLFQKKYIAGTIARLLNCDETEIFAKIKFSSHHLSHAASAYFPSPFEESAVVTFDGVGEWATTTIGYGRYRHLRILQEIRYPHSVGLLYSTITAFCGFKVNAGEYKLMGLAPYGEPRFEKAILENLVNLKSDGSFQLNMKFFDFGKREQMWSSNLESLFGVRCREEGKVLTDVYADLASSVQSATEKIILNLLVKAKEVTKSSNLCLAGGVALNCVANSKILDSGIFDRIWIQPAAGDAGGALGAAFAYLNSYLDSPRKNYGSDLMQGSYLGSEYTREEILIALHNSKSIYSELTDDFLFPEIASSISNGLTVGWFQGRGEFGPRALGNRSILADPRSPEMQRRLNLQTKFRESFRPFAPSVIDSRKSAIFDFNHESPFMLFISKVKNEMLCNSQQEINSDFLERVNQVRSKLPAITHVDNTARLQTVSDSQNPRFHRLIKEFEQLTSFPVLINTSFNIRGEPIVNSPEDALKCFYGTDIDILVMGNFVVKRQDNLERIRDYRREFLND